VGAYADVEKAKASRNIRRGKGKMRNRRYVGRKGPLVVFGEEGGISKAFRNLPGVEVSSVDSLNLLQVGDLCQSISLHSWLSRLRSLASTVC
jgi:large subunit ribosomal protein L4e